MEGKIDLILQTLNTITTDIRHLGEEQRHLGEEQRHLGEEQRHLGEEQRHLGEEQRHLREEQRRLGDEQKRLADELIQQSKRTKALDNSFAEFRGEFYETTFRTQIEKERGRGWSKRYLARSLFDLVKLIPNLKDSLNPLETYNNRAKATTLVAKRLLEKKDELIEKYCIALQKTHGITFNWSDWKTDLSNIISNTKYDPNQPENTVKRELCIKLVTFLTSADIDLFISCSGIGLPFLILETCGKLKDSLEFDCNGKITVLQDFALIEVGEIKSSATGLPYAKKQVTIRCKALGYIVSSIYNVQKLVLMGHIFYGGRKGQQKDSIDDGISIYYHNM
eukprot:TRINITY_DN828_c0_g1_i1.p1 TRINITY_DN828_c0_g1~~TRINITY_DN828_c0_g1_i1.p1  ORF type:complete len:336 (-),score=62.14 TRINITY_DN828_c0_g1_i1:20-1027(-)